jgi:hypothetical protein
VAKKKLRVKKIFHRSYALQQFCSNNHPDDKTKRHALHSEFHAWQLIPKNPCLLYRPRKAATNEFRFLPRIKDFTAALIKKRIKQLVPVCARGVRILKYARGTNALRSRARAANNRQQ